MTDNDKQWMDGALGAFGRLTNWGGFDDTGGDSIRQLLGRPLKGTAPTAGLSGGLPQMAMPTYQDRLEWHRNSQRNRGAMNNFIPGMSFDGRTKLNTQAEYEAYLDSVAAKRAQADMDRLNAAYMRQFE
jgi:hypothetical protein